MSIVVHLRLKCTRMMYCQLPKPATLMGELACVVNKTYLGSVSSIAERRCIGRLFTSLGGRAQMAQLL